ncbi:unnamed protein product [Leptosia nina]|uniref:Uncharacterized protein n=1 Tax=Leptosia nina TaxID=320188 RepID=A0AAV1K2H1_9NEOP
MRLGTHYLQSAAQYYTLYNTPNPEFDPQPRDLQSNALTTQPTNQIKGYKRLMVRVDFAIAHWKGSSVPLVLTDN